ncbi:fungal-specific transcription factor domain-containing protein [Rhexocercosporidium sp. MPI-PUGE-AT-0058]|nr:fungal-specific transcription factor domain-containing protein [Rhexocercosporidium sp. MPI-PUGE-AT-0058]
MSHPQSQTPNSYAETPTDMTDSTTNSMANVEPRVKRRAAKACELCRRRKMKCDNEEPRCTNCKLYGKECQYSELPKRARVSRTHVAQLQEENRRLQARLSVAPSNSVPGSHATASPSTLPNETVEVESAHQADTSMADDDRRSSIIEPSLAAPNAQRYEGHSSQSSYYGRTSALFDEDSSDRRGARVRGLASESTRRQLMGEAAHQRQLETLNYRSGKLDFDGIIPEVGMHLLSLHWNRQHHSHLITYRPAFMRDMASKGPYFSKLLLNAIYFGSCKFSPREDVKGMHTQFRQRVRELLGGALDKSEITTIQAMLVMTNSLFALGDERSAAWIYAGIAFRMLIDLGAHLDSQIPKTTEEDLEIRRRVFWGAFVVDKIQSLYQGRPVSIQEADIRVPILFQDQYEELEEWQPFAYPETQRYHGSPAYSISTFTELCKLSVIMNAILTNVYGVKSAKRAPEQLADDLERMHLDLEKWRDALPEHLVFDPLIRGAVVPPPHVLSLHSMFNVLLILLHRPFVSEGHLHSTSRSIPANSFVICAQAATRIVHLLRTYDKTFSIRHAPYLIAYATYVSATIHVRIAAQLGPGSEAYTCLRTCLNVFVKNQETNWAARRAQSVIVNLMKKMNIELAVDEELTPGAGSSTSVDPSMSSTMEGQTAFSNPHTPHDSGLGGHDSASLPPHHDPIVDLDMDAIISSFIFAQQPYNPNDGFTPVFNKANNNGIPLDQFDHRIDDGWNMLDFGVDGPFDDTLFGFNGPALDGMWQ